MSERDLPRSEPLPVNGSDRLRSRRCWWQLPPLSRLIGVGFVDGRISPAATIVNVSHSSRQLRFAAEGNLPRHG